MHFDSSAFVKRKGTKRKAVTALHQCTDIFKFSVESGNTTYMGALLYVHPATTAHIISHPQVGSVEGVTLDLEPL